MEHKVCAELLTAFNIIVILQLFQSVYLVALVSEKEELKYSLTINGVPSVMIGGVMDHLL